MLFGGGLRHAVSDELLLLPSVWSAKLVCPSWAVTAQLPSIRGESILHQNSTTTAQGVGRKVTVTALAAVHIDGQTKANCRNKHLRMLSKPRKRA